MIECYQLPTAKNYEATHYSLVSNVKTEVGTIDNCVLYSKSGMLDGGVIGTKKIAQIAESQAEQTPKKGDFLLINSIEYRIISDPIFESNPMFKPFFQCEVKTVK